MRGRNWGFGFFFFFFFFFFFLMVSNSSASTYLSDGVFVSHTSNRNLLQVKKECPVNFEYMNYTDLTTRCRGPDYPPEECCPAFKDFACPYAELLNEVSNDCASTMFSYINLYGQYPFGLFTNQCREGKEGLSCPPSSSSSSSSSPHLLAKYRGSDHRVLHVMLAMGLLVVLF